MFEKYTERARRAIFFARYEASQYGSAELRSEQLLLGVIRAGGEPLEVILGESPALIRRAIERRIKIGQKVSTSIDLPWSEESKNILRHAQAESDRMQQGYVGLKHLLLGMIMEEKSLAADVLRDCGLHTDKLVVAQIDDVASEGDTTNRTLVHEVRKSSIMELLAKGWKKLMSNWSNW